MHTRLQAIFTSKRHWVTNDILYVDTCSFVWFSVFYPASYSHLLIIKNTTMTITTNNHYRMILSFFDLTEKEQKEITDNYDTIEESSFFRYRGHVYDLCEFMCNNDNSPFCNDWDGYHNDSFFSAVLVKYSTCNDGVKVGLAIF